MQHHPIRRDPPHHPLAQQRTDRHLELDQLVPETPSHAPPTPPRHHRQRRPSTRHHLHRQERPNHQPDRPTHPAHQTTTTTDARMGTESPWLGWRPDLGNEDGVMPREKSPGKPTTRGCTPSQRRIRRMSGWSASSAPSWAPVKGRCSGSRSSSATASSRCEAGCVHAMSSTVSPARTRKGCTTSRRPTVRWSRSCARPAESERDTAQGSSVFRPGGARHHRSDRRRVHRRLS